MTKLYHLEALKRQIDGTAPGVYLDEVNPTLVTAEEAANKLGLDQRTGVDYVKRTFKPHGEEATVSPVVENLAVLEAAAVDLPEVSRDAVLGAVATAYEALGVQKESVPVDEAFSVSDSDTKAEDKKTVKK